MSQMPTVPGFAVTEHEFPGGIECAGCGRGLYDGDRYAERLSSVLRTIPVTELCCLECAGF